MPEHLLLPRGNYKQLLSYRKAVVIYDGTVIFTNRFLGKFDRTVDQMVQAARSGKQNIVEGCKASRTSTESEIKLLNVARASFEELLEDYEDHLRNLNAAKWEKNDKEALYVRKMGSQPDLPLEAFRAIFKSRISPTVANVLICLIHQENYLLDRQIIRLEKDFLKTGGIRERMTRARLQRRKKSP